MKRTPTGSQSRVKSVRELAARVVAVTRPRHMDPGIPSIPATGGKEWNVGIPPAAKPVEVGEFARARRRSRVAQPLVYSRHATGRRWPVAAPHLLAGAMALVASSSVSRRRPRRRCWPAPRRAVARVSPPRPSGPPTPALPAGLVGWKRAPRIPRRICRHMWTQKAEMPAARRVRMPRYPTETAA